MIRRVTTRGVILHEGKIFCVKQRNSAGEVVDYWCTPGGGLDVGEPLIEGLKREIIEETGITPQIGTLLLVQQFIDSKGREQLELFFHITNPNDFFDINLAETTHGQHEIESFGFVDPKDTYILPKVMSEINFEEIINGKQATLVLNEIPEGTEITVQD